VAKRRVAGDDVVVVVSAMAGDTNRLESLGQGLSDKPNTREMDVLLSAGEQISAALTVMALDQLGYKARSYLGWQVPIITDTNHTKARFESIETKRLKDDLAASITPVVAGIRRIEAVTGRGALVRLDDIERELDAVADVVRGSREELADKVKLLAESNRRLEKEVQSLRSRSAQSESVDLAASAIEIEGIKVLSTQVTGDSEAVMALFDGLRERLDKCVVVLG
jgi:aspartate kinase